VSRRCRVEIEAAILGLSRYGATITQLVYRANLNFKMAHKYLQRMMKEEKIQKIDRLYMPTEKGLKFLKLVEQLL